MAAQPFQFVASPAQLLAFAEGQIAARRERGHEASLRGKPYSQLKQKAEAEVG
jgi:hypothetical protein